MPPPHAPESEVVHFRLRVGAKLLEAEALVPEGPCRIVDLLPVIRALGSGVVQAAEEEVTAAGAAISCRAGCGACCRQPVPIAESEAVMIVELIESLPDERRAVVQRRFDEALAKLEASGLLERVRSLDSLPTPEARQDLGRAYFELGIACPFLEDESCSIHAARPLACREYLVTSPASCCASPTPESIELVPVPVRPSVTLFRFDERGEEGPPQALPMILVREWAEEHPEAVEATIPGPQLFERYVRRLAGESR